MGTYRKLSRYNCNRTCGHKRNNKHDRKHTRKTKYKHKRYNIFILLLFYFFDTFPHVKSLEHMVLGGLPVPVYG